MVRIPCWVGGNECSALMRYSLKDPYVINFKFYQRNTYLNAWDIGRELLTEGLDGYIGEDYSDVLISADDVNTIITLSSDDGIAHIIFYTEDLKKFLQLTYSAIPRQTEGNSIDWDYERTILFGS